MPDKTDNIISVSSLSFQFGRTRVLTDISFECPAGIFLSIIGPNGAGKTTLIKNISGLLKCGKKSVFIDDRDVRLLSRNELARTMGQVAQQTRADVAFTVQETVMMGRYPHLKFFSREGLADKAKVAEALFITDMSALAGRDITTLSGGELQRVMIAQALAQDTPILLLDEPTAHLDLSHERTILGLLKKMQQEKGLTIVAVFHDLNLAAAYSDCIILLKEGTIVAAGAPETVITKERIKAVYGVDVLIIPHPESGRPCVLHS